MNAHILEATNITPEEIRAAAQAKFDAGYRLVTISLRVVDEEHVELLYHFDKENEMTHLRMQAHRDADIPSISAIYFCALLSENEARDLFDLKFEGLVLDYKRTLFLAEDAKNIVNAPFFYTASAKPAAKRT